MALRRVVFVLSSFVSVVVVVAVSVVVVSSWDNEERMR